jgi:hypothetical protein
MVDLREALRPLRESPVADPEPVERLAGRVVRRRRRRRVAAGAAGAAIAAMVAVGVWAGGSSHPEVVQVAGPAEPESSRPGGGLELTYLPEGFALADDVEHVRHQLGDRLRVLTYGSNAPAAGPTFEVHRKVGNPLNVAGELQLDPSATATEVNGHEGVSLPGPDVALGWLETPEVTLWVTSRRLSEAEIRRIADGIRYDPAEDSPTVSDASGPIDPGDQNRQLSERVVVADGEVDGVAWRLEVYESDAGLCADLRYYRGTSGGCGFDVPAQRVIGIGSARFGALQAIYGPVRRNVATIQVHLASGEIITVTPVGQDLGFPVHFYVAVVPADDPADVIVAFNTAGGEVARESV